MVSMKRSIAALIVCFKPHVLLTLCILLVIVHSIVVTVQRGAGNSWRFGKQHDLTITMITLVLVVALIWAAFFIFVVRFELRNELESLLVLFQCSKRGLRFMGVVGFHVALLSLVALLVSVTVERSVPIETADGRPSGGRHNNTTMALQHLCRAKNAPFDQDRAAVGDYAYDGDLIGPAGRRRQLAGDKAKMRPLPGASPGGQFEARKGKLDREYLLTVYKIWLTAIVYAFSYLLIENVVMFYADMSLIEFIHDSFLSLVARTTGIDLSDYPAGEMLFNPLVRHRIR